MCQRAKQRRNDKPFQSVADSRNTAPRPVCGGVGDEAGDFWEIVDDAIEENERIIASTPWPPPAAMDPFNFACNSRPPPFNFHSAEGQWETMKEFSRCQEAQDLAQKLLNSPSVSSPPAPVQGCTAITNEPNHTARSASMGPVPLRYDIDFPPALFQSPLGDPSQKVMIMEDDVPEELLNVDEWKDFQVEMVLDSGCCAHILDAQADAPGYTLQESEGSRGGRGFIVGNGERIPNEGQVHLNLEIPNGNGGSQPMRSTFQSARVTRPLMSVSQICDHGFTCVFRKDRAIVLDDKNQPRFECERRGGLYMAPMTLKAPTHPAPFQRQEP